MILPYSPLQAGPDCRQHPVLYLGGQPGASGLTGGRGTRCRTAAGRGRGRRRRRQHPATAAGGVAAAVWGRRRRRRVIWPAAAAAARRCLVWFIRRCWERISGKGAQAWWHTLKARLPVLNGGVSPLLECGRIGSPLVVLPADCRMLLLSLVYTVYLSSSTV